METEYHMIAHTLIVAGFAILVCCFINIC